MEFKGINSADKFQNAIDITNEVGKCINEPTALAKFKRKIDNFEMDANGNGELAETYLFRAITFYHEWATAHYHQWALERPRINEDFSKSCCICSMQFFASTPVDRRMLHFISSGHWKTFAGLLEERGLGRSERMTHAHAAVIRINRDRFNVKRAKKATKAEKEAMAVSKLQPNRLPKWLAESASMKTLFPEKPSLAKTLSQEKPSQAFVRVGNQLARKDREKLQAKAQNNDKKYEGNGRNIRKKLPKEVKDGTKAWRCKSSRRGTSILRSTRTDWRSDRAYDFARNHMEINDQETPNDEFDLAQIN